MSNRVEILAGWDGSALIPLHKYQPMCDSALVIGERYIAALEPLSSPASRRHYFSCIHDLFASWPEAHPRQFQTEDHLRRWALIRCGFRAEQQFAAANKAEARRLASFLSADDEYAELSVNENVVIKWRALSQKQHAMGREQFGRSKTEVLAFLAGEVGVTVESLAPPREEPPMRESER
jgi:hypothetical protein